MKGGNIVEGVDVEPSPVKGVTVTRSEERESEGGEEGGGEGGGDDLSGERPSDKFVSDKNIHLMCMR